MTTSLDSIMLSGQIAAIALGLFVAIWGMFEFGHCLYRVLRGHYDRPNVHDLCPYHAMSAMMCITTILFCLARANTIGVFNFGDYFSGALFLAGMVTTCLTVALGIWARARTHHGAPLTPLMGHPALAHMFRMMLIIILAFILLGLVRAS